MRSEPSPSGEGLPLLLFLIVNVGLVVFVLWSTRSC